jgi:hypothetical protein
MNWGEAKATATGFIHRRDINWDTVQPLAHDDMAHELLIQDIEEAVTLLPVVQGGTPYYAVPLPDDFARARSVTQKNGGADMQGVPAKVFRSRLCGPDSYTILGNRLWTYLGGAVDLVYSRRLPSIVDDQTNEVLSAYSNVYIYALLKHGAVMAQDFDSADRFEAMFDRAVGKANEAYTAATLASGMGPTVQGGIV